MYAELTLFIDSDDEELTKLYIEQANKRNSKFDENRYMLDAGFDLFVPNREYTNNGNMLSINFNVSGSMKIYDENNNISYQSGYYMHPRSSISKTPFRLANNTGIIDAGYRGNLIGMFDIINNKEKEIYDTISYNRLIQITAPGLIPMKIELLHKNKMSDYLCWSFSHCNTERGENGIGSTGI